MRLGRLIVSSCDTPKNKRKSLTCLTNSVRFVDSDGAAVADSESRTTQLMLELCLILSLVLLPISNAVAITDTTSKELFKLYAHTKLLNSKEYGCIEKLWDRESRWDPRATNRHSTAYGIPQLLDLKEANGFRQIDLGIKYIVHRYGTPCNALMHHKKVGNY